MIESNNIKLIVNVAIVLVLIGTCLVPIIDSVSSNGTTEERFVPTLVTNGELYDSRHNAPDGTWDIEYMDGVLHRNIEINYDRLYVDSTYQEGTYYLEGTISDAGDLYECQLISWCGTHREEVKHFGIYKDEAEEYGISDKGYLSATVQMYVSENYMGNQLVADVILGNSGNFEDRPTVYITIISRGVVAYEGKPDLTTNGYRADQVMLNSGLTYSATTDAYVVTGTNPSGTNTVNKVTVNNAFVGYSDNNESQPIYMFNANKDSNTFAPIDNNNKFLGVEHIDHNLYFNVKDITIYHKQNVPIESPYKAMMMIAPLLLIVAVVVFIVRQFYINE